MQRFSDDHLQALNVDPARSLYAVCPFCGGDMVLGYRKDNGNLSMGHSVVALPGTRAPNGAVQQALNSGCDTFRELVSTDPRELFRLLKGHGTKWARLVT